MENEAAFHKIISNFFYLVASTDIRLTGSLCAGFSRFWVVGTDYQSLPAVSNKYEQLINQDPTKDMLDSNGLTYQDIKVNRYTLPKLKNPLVISNILDLCSI